jgi:uncharacterized protein (TIGR02265 family)
MNAPVTDTFVEPDWKAPVDVAAAVNAAPTNETVKGYLLQAVLEEAKKAGKAWPGRAKYVGFKDYSIREHVETIAMGARVIYPELPIREGLRRLGRRAYPALLESLVGKVVFGALGRDLESALKIVSRGYQISATKGSAQLLDVGSNHALIKIWDIWTWPDAYHVGIFEGALTIYDKVGRIRVRLVQPTEAELQINW